MEDKIVEPPGSHEPTAHEKTPKKAAASGWIGSALEYYDFFIYAQAVALVFPAVFFPAGNSQTAIVFSFATLASVTPPARSVRSCSATSGTSTGASRCSSCACS